MNTIQNLGLIETTTDRQFKNGTREYLDPQTGEYYSMHASGYVRRIIKYRPGAKDSYQLNPVRINPRPNGTAGYERVMVSFTEQLEILGRRVVSYRIYVAKKKAKQQSK